MDEKPVLKAQPNRWVLLVFLAVSLYACFLLVEPFLQPIIIAILIGMLTIPLHERLVTKLNGRQNIAALLSVLLLTLVLLIPATMVLAAILKQGITYSLMVKEWAAAENVHDLFQQPWMLDVRAWLDRVLPADALNPDKIRSQALAAASAAGKQFAGVSTAMLGSVTSFVIDFGLVLFVLFFVLRDHNKLFEFIRHALPLSRSQEDALLQEVVEVSKSALLGSFLTAITQGFVGGFGFFLVGIPALFWGSMMAVSSLIPVVGTALVWVPATIYLFVTGETGWAIFMMIWGVLVIGSVDNFLRPLFMQGSSMGTVVVFFSLLGGLHVFGLAGLIYGPIIFSIALVFFRLYENEFSDFLELQDKS
jgi:predicted PurR-regulated permease PerM